MRRRSFIAMAASVLALPGRATLAGPAKMTVYKDPNCGCCHEWSKAMAAAGFSADTRDTDDLAAVKARLGVPADLEGCHTAVVEKYYLEGHVPLEAVQRLLRERPPLRGLAVPGMPSGSLGMGDDPTASYDVYAIRSETGAPYVFMEVRPPKG
ncbi:MULTISPECIES: DUF411 domain-containing protein [Rhizobium]|uniref:DUF411 domain-containing protein n=1 Tax=Rhizobium TaxID=379 RepID=UPI0007EB621B|nr:MULTISPECIES: DUF411 domain-containing protein [Rhizobium]ANK89306.1 hypothetical protein AMK02_PE00243 [Rhizobium sp. N731]ANK94660.1 hypothetical protein AMK01_PC00244 [Rhizobium sp. N6212]ANL00710.1 hypothetical protein AMK00_PC00244 [Rhizobium sp. N621]ANL06831.1 hypothetical protein AMJ99_PC00244 [Rhizobium esperanzae]ANL13001.1 hypothetical protein AMJ98_PD00243 [Rhizobium sp. N1341]